MRTRRILPALSLVALVATLYVSACGVGPVPALGPLLDPGRGLWTAAAHAELAARATASIPGLGAEVEVHYDERGVPHIFAQSELDAYRALGYVVARDRLFQLDLQTRAGAGRLSQLVGAVAREADRSTRSLGMARAALQQWRALPADGLGRQMLDAYADGVNAYLDAVPRRAWPIEYRLLEAVPERWEAVNSLHLFMRMSQILTYIPTEFERYAAQARVGNEAARALFPQDSRIQEAIEPGVFPSPWFDTSAFAPPGAPDTSAVTRAFAAATSAAPARGGGHFASNNWAVAPRRARNGYALLAGDPHLELNLPSIWYEAHLVVPGVLDAYGVTIPGAPGIIIGFNRDVAWSFTNTGADVVDFYRETVDDVQLPTQYLVDGEWRPVQRDVEIVRDREGNAIAVDTMLYTHRGPMARRGDLWLSMRWLPLEAPLDATAFVQAAKARSATAYLDSMARYWTAPAQNMLAADRSGSIAIRSTGHFPRRPAGADGLTILDGSVGANDWQGRLDVGQYPQAVNPAQGFLASANQQPVDARAGRAAIGQADAFETWRALQINRLLRADSSVTPDDMRRYQTDPGSVRADLWVPLLLEATGGAKGPAEVAGGTPPPADTSALGAARRMLAEWDRRYTTDTPHAVLFETTLRQVVRLLYDELEDSSGRRVANPAGDITLALARQPQNGWWDRRDTPAREDRNAILRSALEEAYTSLVQELGAPAPASWAWGRVRPASITHLLQMRGFGAESVAVQGALGTLNPSAGTGYGSSWRMVVELGPTLRAWGIYPGGQSGNPASSRYRDRIARWSRGELDTLRQPAVPGDLTSFHMLRLRPSRN